MSAASSKPVSSLVWTGIMGLPGGSEGWIMRVERGAAPDAAHCSPLVAAITAQRVLTARTLSLASPSPSLCGT